MKNRIFLMFLSVLITIMALLLIFAYLLENSTINKLSTNNLNEQIVSKTEFFNKYINKKVNTLDSLTNSKLLKEYLNGELSEDIIKETLISFAKSNKDIFQFRYLDSSGKEIIRVDNNQKVNVIAKDKLQDKSGRYYFKETIKLNKGELYFSNIDLNMERGKIQKPFIPTLRVAAPVFIDNIKKGIFIININIGIYFEVFKKSSLYDIGLVYSDGNIMIYNDPKVNWTRDLKKDIKVYNLIKELDKNFNKKKIIQNENFSLSKLNIKTPNEIYLLITPKSFESYDYVHNEIQKFLYILFLITILSVPVGFFISRYIDSLYKEKLLFEKAKIEHILLNSVINSTDDLIFYKDKDFKYLGCNEAFEKFVGKKHNEIVGKSDFELFDNEHAELFRSMDKKMFLENKSRINDEWVRYPDGSKVYLHTQKTPFVYDESGEVGILGLSRDITELHKIQKKLEEQTYIDDLTQTFNRKAFNEKILEKLNLNRRYKAPFCIAMFDIDNFKVINDTYGHDAGDKVLKEMTAFTVSILRKTDILFRVGGEEFIILYPKTELENALLATNKVLKGIPELKVIENKSVTVSIGLTEVNQDDDIETIYKRVDELLYHSKHNGKNRITKG